MPRRVPYSGDPWPVQTTLNRGTIGGSTPGGSGFGNAAAPYAPMQQPTTRFQSGPMPGVPNMMSLPGQGAISRAGDWLKGALGDGMDWLGEGDNLMKAGGLALGAYGAHQQGRAADREFEAMERNREEDRKRVDDEQRRRAEAARMLLPQILMNMGQGG